MFYRETGQYKTSYAADMALFPIRQDRIGMMLILLVAFVVIPLTMSSFTLVGGDDPDPDLFARIDRPQPAHRLYRPDLARHRGLHGRRRLCDATSSPPVFPDANIVLLILLSGFFSAAVGAIFGLPSLRIKGFYLTVATLAAQFFLSWCFVRVPWLVNYNVSNAIEVPTRTMFDIPITGPNATPVTRYLVVLTVVVVMTWIASNIVRGRIGRSWMAVRDMDIAAELIGIRLYRTKLLAFAVSSFYCGVAGALMVFLWLGAAEADSFNINQSFIILFMVIIGGLGSLVGSFLRRRLHLGPADPAANFFRPCSEYRCTLRPLSTSSSWWSARSSFSS